EHGCGGAVLARGGQRDLEGEHHAGELTAGSGLGDGQGPRTGVRGEQDRDRVPAVGAVGLGGDVHADVRIRHLQVAQLLLHRGGEGGGGVRAGRGERLGGRGELLLELREPGGGLLALLFGALEAVEVDGRGARGGQQGGDVLGRAVRTGQHRAEIP